MIGSCGDCRGYDCRLVSFAGAGKAPHVHPYGQDSWTILKGEGLYYLSESEQHPVAAGDVAIAPIGQIHGVRNTGMEALILISTVTPSTAGYMPIAMVG